MTKAIGCRPWLYRYTVNDMLLLNVQTLRKQGIRLDVPGPVADGYLRSERANGFTALTLISHMGGISRLGPLYEARLVRTEPEGFVLLGFEVGTDGASYVQEWLCTRFDGSIVRPFNVEARSVEGAA